MKPTALRTLIADHFDWAGWEALIQQHGITIDRPQGSAHPDYPRILYPLDYGYVNGTVATDGHEVDVFVGTASNGLVATILTHDHRRGDREFKLLYNCTPREIYLAHGFINYDRFLLEGVLVPRQPMRALWTREQE